VSCPICEKRKESRFCPAKGEKICAVCCGTYREVTIDCPPDCSYLVAAHRYEDEHQRELPADTPLLDAKISRDDIHMHQTVLSGIAFAAAKFCANHADATDPDILAALESLAETYKTLSSGILYERPPVLPIQRELYAVLAAFLNEAKLNPAQASALAANSTVPPNLPPIKDAEIFSLLVFLYRMGLLRTNGRPRARRFIHFLRSQFPASPESHREESRIILP
jgi:hypothetical protein